MRWFDTLTLTAVCVLFGSLLGWAVRGTQKQSPDFRCTVADGDCVSLIEGVRCQCSPEPQQSASPAKNLELRPGTAYDNKIRFFESSKQWLSWSPEARTLEVNCSGRSVAVSVDEVTKRLCQAKNPEPFPGIKLMTAPEGEFVLQPNTDNTPAKTRPCGGTSPNLITTEACNAGMKP